MPLKHGADVSAASPRRAQPSHIQKGRCTLPAPDQMANRMRYPKQVSIGIAEFRRWNAKGMPLLPAGILGRRADCRLTGRKSPGLCCWTDLWINGCH